VAPVRGPVTGWRVLRIAPCRALGDPLAGLLVEAGALGTWEDGDALVAYFPEKTERDAVDSRVGTWLGHLSDGGPLPTLAWSEEPGKDWVTASREALGPVPVGRRLVVLPEWAPEGAGGDRLSVRIRPGAGFGTGAHPTTAACLEALERALDAQPNAAVLDVGTGSGVLALAAARLGAERVVGVDIDPDALANARDNRALNALPGVALVLGGIEAVRGPFDLVLANLLANVIVDLLPALAGVLAPGGRLVLAGLLTSQGDRIEAALAAEGLAATTYDARAGWLTLEAGRPGAPQ
jgi:ribosomal protein L11 methyltransferase